MQNLNENRNPFRFGSDRSDIKSIEGGGQTVALMNLTRIATSLGTFSSQLLASAGPSSRS